MLLPLAFSGCQAQSTHMDKAWSFMGDDAVYLESAAIGGTTLLPYWHVWLNVSDVPLSHQQGFELYVSAKNGAVAKIKTFQLPPTSGWTVEQTPPILVIWVLLIPIVSGLVTLLVLLIVILKVTSPKKSPVKTEQSKPAVG